MSAERIICWFSCGVTSTVATKMIIGNNQGRDVHVCYCDTASEHPDNARYLRECEEWFGLSIEVLKSERYEDIWDVFERTRWLVGTQGARCTTELKKVVRMAYQRPGDIHVMGFDSSERTRAARFIANNHDVIVSTPLIDRRMSKEDCARVVADAGIRLPQMYLLGYPNNNCVGCVKGQMGYWNKIRVDFPDVFARMSAVERDLDVAINKTYAGGERQRVFLDELDQDAGDITAEDFTCGGMGCSEQYDLFAGRLSERSPGRFRAMRGVER